jgi:hypothetical protein
VICRTLDRSSVTGFVPRTAPELDGQGENLRIFDGVLARNADASVKPVTKPVGSLAKGQS